MNQNWISIFGNATCAKDKIIFIPNTPIDSLSPENPSIPPHTWLRSNIEFEQGIISFEFKFLEENSKCQIGLSSGQSGDLFAGVNVLGAVYGFATFRNPNWDALGGIGHGSTIAINQWHKLKLIVRGSNIDLYFNEVKVFSISHRIQKGPVNLLLQGLQTIEVRDIKIEQKSPVCFVVMQFTEEYNSLYKEVILPTCEKFGYTVVRGDDFYTSGLIIEDITLSIQESAIVIADVTPNNPNVFYEVGYAHGIGKPTILLSDRKRDKLPFDISGFRTLFYDNTIGGKSAVEERLKKHLENIENKN